MVTFGSWLNSQTGADGHIGKFAQHVMYRHPAGCSTCQYKEDDEELAWGVAEVVRDLDGHSASPEYYEMLDEAVAAWSAQRGARSYIMGRSIGASEGKLRPRGCRSPDRR